MNKPPAKITRAQWIVRIVFAVVFFLNIQCAFQFIVSPEHYLAAYELEGVSGSIALQRTWNCLSYVECDLSPLSH